MSDKKIAKEAKFSLALDDINTVTQKLKFDSFLYRDHDLLVQPDLRINYSENPLANSKHNIH